MSLINDVLAVLKESHPNPLQVEDIHRSIVGRGVVVELKSVRKKLSLLFTQRRVTKKSLPVERQPGYQHQRMPRKVYVLRDVPVAA